MNKVSIVIPNYNRWDLCHQTLFDIYNKCHLPSIQEVIIVNDGCTEKASFTGLQWWKGTGMLPIRELRIDENVGFLLASNWGVQNAQGEIVTLLSNDVRIYKDFVTLLVDMVKSDPKILVGGRYLDWDTGWNTFGSKIFPYIEGWILAGTAEAWKDWNYFDERFVPNDYEDIDLSTTAIQKGYSLISMPENFFQHLGGQTIGFNPKRESITLQNKEKFREKWITIPLEK